MATLSTFNLFNNILASDFVFSSLNGTYTTSFQIFYFFFIVSSDHQPVGLVFGISLAKCIANDLELQKRRQSNPNRNENDDVIIHRRDHRKSSTSSSQGSLDNVGHNGNTLSPDDVYKVSIYLLCTQQIFFYFKCA